MPRMSVSGYLRALPSIIRRQSEEWAYRVYVTDTLKVIAENTMRHVVPGHGAVEYGASMSRRWLDVIDPPEPVVPDDRPAGVIAAGIWQRARIGRKAVSK